MTSKVRFPNWLFIVAWVIAIAILYTIGLVFTLIYCVIPIILLHGLLKISLKILFLAVVGVSIANFGKIIRLNPEEKKQMVEFIKNKKLVLLSIFIIWIDFTLASVIGDRIYYFASVGLLIPLLWFSVEAWFIEKGLWYLSPAGLITMVITIPLKMKTRIEPTYFLAGMGILPLAGKVQKSLP